MAIESPEELTVGLFERGAIGYATSKDLELGQPGAFIKLKSGRLSPTYVNTRGLTSFSKKSNMPIEDQASLRELVISSYGEVIDEGRQPYDHLLGIPHAMTALGAMIGLLRQDSVLSMRTEEKSHGIPKIIEGDYQAGEIVLGLDDVVTDGASKLETVAKIRAAGLEISRFVILVDREEGGQQVMEDNQPEISSALGMGAITAILYDQKLITKEQVNWTGEYYQALIDAEVIESIPEALAGIL